MNPNLINSYKLYAVGTAKLGAVLLAIVLIFLRVAV